MNPHKEELSFAPFHLRRTHNQPNYTRSKTVSNYIHELLAFPSFLNILYSYSEVSYIRSNYSNPEITTDNINKLIAKCNDSNDNRQPILEEINSMIIKQNNYTSAFEAFKSVHLIETVTKWLHPSISPIEKCLILNIISFCLQFSETPKKNLSNLWKLIFESVLSTNEGTCIKKHLLVLLQIVDIISDFGSINEPVIRYTSPQSSSILSSIENPVVFPLLVFGEPPKSFETGDEVIKKISENDKSYLKYFNNGTFSSETQNEDCREFLMINGQLFIQFVQFINRILFTSSRIFAPKSEINLVYNPSNLSETEKFDNLRERDIIFFSSWSLLHVINSLLVKSNFMDAAIFQYYISQKYDSNNIILTCMKCFLSDLKLIEKVELVDTEKLAYKDDKSLPSIIELALGVALHSTADFVSNSFKIMNNYVTDKDVKSIVKIADISDSTVIKSEAAYAVSKYSRWIPAQLKKKPNLQIINFMFLNLNEFELFEKFNNENKTELQPKCIGPNHIEQIKKHAANLNLQISF